jgi:hypothetical protein
MSDFAANMARVHQVETEWHYPYLHAAGFVADTKGWSCSVLQISSP